MTGPGADSHVDWWHREGPACGGSFGAPYRFELNP
jgi:hypothetical protein